VGVVVSPDGKTLYVATGHGNSVSVIDMAAQKVTKVVAVGKRPWGLALTPDGKKLYTANGESDDVSVIDTASLKVIATIPRARGRGGGDVAVEDPEVAVRRVSTRPALGWNRGAGRQGIQSQAVLPLRGGGGSSSPPLAIFSVSRVNVRNTSFLFGLGFFIRVCSLQFWG
jgi:YVTN family beta-propeller protein